MLRGLFALAAFAIAGHAVAADKGVGEKVGPVKFTSLDGKAATVESVRGKAATVVVFVSFECPVSNYYIAGLTDFAKAHAEKGVAVIAVVPSVEPADAVRKAAADAKLAVPVYLDPKKEAAAAFKAEITPEAFVLDGTGVVRYRGRIDDAYSARLKKNPTVSSFDLTNALDDVLAGKPVRTPVTKAVGCPVEYAEATPAKPGSVTYARHVAPILNTHCVVCHRPGEVGPFSLTNYAQAKRWATDIGIYTESRKMPPWMPTAGVPMKGERKLTAAEIATLAAWVEGGAPEGDPKDMPPAPSFGDDGWRFGKPDLILTPGDDFHVGGTGNDLFRVFVVPTGLTENKWVVGYDVKPGAPQIVHHTLHFFDTTGQGRGMEAKQLAKDKAEVEKGNLVPDRGPGYTSGMGVGFVANRGKRDNPAFGDLGGWAPGQMPTRLPPGNGWLLPKGSDFLVQTHYHRNGRPGTDRTRIGLYFATEPITQPWQTITVNGMKPTEKIKAGNADHAASGAVYLHTDAVLHNVLPHMHLLGKSVKMTLTPPGGRPFTLIDIPAWDYNWQETYWFKEPIPVKAGTKIEIAAVFDNSPANPHNPTRPPKDVSVGEQTTDEMLFGFLGATSGQSPSQVIRTSAFPPPGIATVPAPIKGQLTPALEHHLGEWTAAVVAKTTGSPETKLDRTETVVKAYDGTFLLVRFSNSEDGSETFELATFDPERQMYRMWSYTSQGAIIEWEGTWDAAAETITWKAPLSGDLKGEVKWGCKAGDTLTWEFKARLGFVNVYTAVGTMSRKK